MHSLTPATPPTTDLTALRTRQRDGGWYEEGWLRPVEVYAAAQVQWNQASIPSFDRQPALTWKYSTHSTAFKVRSHTPARTMTHAVLRLPPPPASAESTPSATGLLANERATDALFCISTSVIELRFSRPKATDGTRYPVGAIRLPSRIWDARGAVRDQNFREWASTERRRSADCFNDSFLNEDRKAGLSGGTRGSREDGSPIIGLSIGLVGRQSDRLCSWEVWARFRRILESIVRKSNGCDGGWINEKVPPF